MRNSSLQTASQRASGKAGRVLLKRPEPLPIRKHWGLAEGTVFLNHGSFGACPEAIVMIQNELRRQMEAEPVQFLWRRYEERLEPARAELADFVGAHAQDLVFVTNATTAVNSVANSIELREGEEILTTDLDYNACRNVLAETAKRRGAKLVTARIPFPLQTEDEVLEAVLDRTNERTRLVMIDHVTSNTALVLPVQKLIRELEGKGIPVLVDGAHAPGMLPLELDNLNASYYTGNLHKWVCAPKGAAFLWVRRDHQTELQPAVISHGNNTPRPGYSGFQDRFDWAGTFDPSAWFCVGETIRFMSSLVPGGWGEIYERNRTLAVEARNLLCAEFQVEPPCPEVFLEAMATLPLPARFQGRPKEAKIDKEQLELYDHFGIEVPWSRFGEPETRYFRISAHLYNHRDEYHYLAQAFGKLR